jgi:hypothetical protein
VKPETVVHVAGKGKAIMQSCVECAFVLWNLGTETQETPPPWAEGELVGVRIDTTFKDGFVVGYFPIGERDLEDDERRCTVSS